MTKRIKFNKYAANYEYIEIVSSSGEVFTL